VVEHPIQLLPIDSKLILAVGLEGYHIPGLNSLGQKILIGKSHYADQRFLCQRLEDDRLFRGYRLHKAIPVVRVPIPIAAPHIELVEVYEEEVVFQKAPTALPPALHIVVVLEHVMVHKQSVANCDGALVAQWQRHHLALAVGKAVVFLTRAYDEVALGVVVSVSANYKLIDRSQKLILYSIEVGIIALNSFHKTTMSPLSMYMRIPPVSSLYLIK